MVGPEGEEHWALAEYLDIQVHKTFAVLDTFADAAGNPNKDLPQSKWVVTFTDKGAVTLVESVITYADLAQLEATIKMGFREGLAMAMENLDELFAASK